MSVHRPAIFARAPEPQLVCLRCGGIHGADARFCAECGLPLILEPPRPALADSVSPRRAAARKIKPQFSEGRLVKVAHAGNVAEAEYVQMLLLEEGVPSVLRRSAGFDVADFLAAGPRDVLVAQSGAAAAREALLGSGLGSGEAELAAAAARPAPLMLLGALLGALALGAAVIWLLSLLIS